MEIPVIFIIIFYPEKPTDRDTEFDALQMEYKKGSPFTKKRKKMS